MHDDGILNIESMKSRCSPAEWQARADLAACYRLVAIYGMSDMMANPISARVPDEDGAFPINACGMMRKAPKWQQPCSTAFLERRNSDCYLFDSR